MTDAPDRPSEDLGELIELLPWYLNGTLTRDDRERVERALARSAELRERLRETAEALDLADENPSTRTLVERAAGELDGAERNAVDAHLERAPRDAELVAMAREGLAAAAETGGGGDVVARIPPRPSSNRWRALAIAASLVAVAAIAGWLSSSRPRGGPGGSIARAPVTEVQVIELLPDDLVLRGGDDEPPRIDDRRRVALVLVTENAGERDELALSARDEEDREIARLEGIELEDDGTVSVLLEADLVTATTTLVLLARDPATDDAPRVLHRYRLRTRSGPPALP